MRIFFDFFKIVDAEEFKAYKTTEIAPVLQKETDEKVNSYRILDKEYVYKLRNSKRRKALETRCDVASNS